ncbi:hypothetical protein D3D02_06910 [Halobellus sp. Atlit-38R]|uniref:hypothetical protein n=1 Tax=Halobellus sp. Atlit-38R TaxID=2282131 RepID=UPI000EF2257D|nr:hypothetical protein [Halobellus sp. Atlit-38R]RLM89604.1 hypothetical protein D3D02_06910 [Halobellus sp. Atlit-38R]
MVEERLTDGRRIAQFLASEVTGHEDDLRSLSVTDADPDVEPTPDGAFAYAIERAERDDGGDDGGDGDADSTRVASVFVQPERVRVEFEAAVDDVADAAREEGLRVRPKAVEPPRTLVFVEDGAQVKWLLPALRAVASSSSE